MLREIIRNDSAVNQKDFDTFLDSLLSEKSKRSSLIALMAALAAKPLALTDIINFVDFIERESPKRRLSISDKLINIVGTGGGISTFNISTSAAFVAAAAGATVLKSGSFSYNSQCGSLDLLTSLGINININEQHLETMLEELHIGFVNPAMYPPLLRRIAVSIMPLDMRDIGGFINKIGPLLCPFEVHGQVCGVSHYEYIDIFAKALQQRGIHNSIAVWAEAGMDEFSAIGHSYYASVKKDIRKVVFNPKDYGIDHADIREIKGGTAADNLAMLQTILSAGVPQAGSDTVIINAAFMLQLAGKAATIEEGLALARCAITSGDAARLLKQAVEFSHDYAERACT
ncbi:anthranilate phosphoribosyltransferase [Maricurvus nonylphenolicus]|uniref:anthranilate phosphoribosyltransferase n=1 Tax=Maricurvus nonylphenolicus TaxID=1008307 RepID=UPI0036F38E79